MGTRSTIAIRNDNGTVTGIYCHWDGYLSHNGRILQDYYTDEARVRELIALGDLSSLGATIGEQHNFNAPDPAETLAETRCTAYARDRGETGVDARTCATYEEFIEQMGQEYDYLFENGAWTVRSYDGTAVLAEALTAEEAA